MNRMSERETAVELPFAADRCPCVEKLRTEGACGGEAGVSERTLSHVEWWWVAALAGGLTPTQRGGDCGNGHLPGAGRHESHHAMLCMYHSRTG
jgi:hypothetical protein